MLAAFGGCLGAPFHFDDLAIFDDPAVTSPDGWWRLWQPSRTRPFTYLTFWLNYQLGGSHPAGYHAVNLAVHLACVLMVRRVLSRLVPERAALPATLVFALHPVQTEAVISVFARAILLATLFCLLSARAWLEGRRNLSVALFAAALLSKEECAAFPLALGLVAGRAAWQTAGIMLVLSAAAGLRVIWATSAVAGAGSGFDAGYTPLEYLLAQGAAIWRYLRLLVLPVGFTIDPEISGPGLPGWIALAGLALILRGQPRVAFAAGLVLLLPSSSIFPAADLAADRRLYLPLIAFGAAAGLWFQRVRMPVLMAAAALLTGLSVHRTWVWQSPQRLWREALDKAPAKIRPRIQLARVSSPAEAEKWLLEAQRLAPNDPLPPSELGRLYLTTGDPARALEPFGRAHALAPDDPRAWNNRGVALWALGQNEAARQDFREALRRSPCFFEALRNARRLDPTTPVPAACVLSAGQKAELEMQ